MKSRINSFVVLFLAVSLILPTTGSASSSSSLEKQLNALEMTINALVQQRPNRQKVTVVDTQAPAIVKVIRDETLRSNNDPNGRPLPLVAHWHRASLPLSYQIKLIQDGYPILPWLDYYRTHSSSSVLTKHSESLKKLRAWGLPLTLLTGGQWEADFYSDATYKSLPIEQTGVGMNLDGTRMKTVSPMSPVEPWRGLGEKWTNNPAVAAIEELYPDPPKIFFISNNEASKLGWTDVKTDKRYVEQYASLEPNLTQEQRRKLVGDAYIERYSALFDGMKQGLTAPAWKENSLYVGYNAYGPDHFGRWGAWKTYSDTIDGRIAWQPSAWDGGVPETYDNDWEPSKTAFNLWSMQTETMNLAFMKDEVFAKNPDYWLELITWDGDTWRSNNAKSKRYAAAGVSYTPGLYEGWTQYNSWLLKPRVVREFRSSADNKDNWWPYFKVILDSTKRIHDDPVLTRFWRLGTLVKNTESKHPFQQDIPVSYENVDRWYHLATDLDPAIPRRNNGGVDIWNDGGYNPEFPVWTMAQVIGEKPNREWLVYAFSPKENRTGVTIKIPDFCNIKMDVPINGAFKYVKEQDGCHQESIGTSGLRLRFTFDDANLFTKSGELLDNSGNGFVGVGINPKGTPVSGISGNGMSFAGDAGSAIVLKPNIKNIFDPETLFSKGGTVSYWIHGTQPSAFYGNIAISSNGTEGWSIYSAGDFRFKLLLTTNGVAKEYGLVTIPKDGKWHHVIQQIDSTGAFNHYLDGVKVSSGNVAIRLPKHHGNGTLIASRFNGIIDDLRFYDTVLSYPEISSLYAEVGTTTKNTIPLVVSSSTTPTPPPPGTTPPPPTPVITPSPQTPPVITTPPVNQGPRYQTTEALRVRATPSVNGTSLGTQPKGAQGTRIGAPVTADNVTWYNMNYDQGVDGWSASTYLTPAVTPGTSAQSPTTPTLTCTPEHSIGDTIQTNARRTKIYSTPDGRSISTRSRNATATITATTCVGTTTWYKLDFKKGKDGYVQEGRVR